MSTIDHRPSTTVRGLWSMVDTGGQQKICSFTSAYYLNYVFVQKPPVEPGWNKLLIKNPDLSLHVAIYTAP